jgi:hypothetical protein
MQSLCDSPKVIGKTFIFTRYYRRLAKIRHDDDEIIGKMMMVKEKNNHLLPCSTRCFV